jgi:hypothetical protein
MVATFSCRESMGLTLEHLIEGFKHLFETRVSRPARIASRQGEVNGSETVLVGC